MTNKNKLNLREKFKYFILYSKPGKDIIYSHTIILISSILIYFISDINIALFLLSVLVLEFVFLQFIWAYRDNSDKENQIKTAIIQLSIKFIVATIFVVLYYLTIKIIYMFTGIYLFIPAAIFIFIIYMSYSIYRLEKI